MAHNGSPIIDRNHERIEASCKEKKKDFKLLRQ